jgi:Uma2 family endonuclease
LSTSTARNPSLDWTDEDVMALPHIGKTELVHGKVIMSPAGFEHGNLGTRLGAALLEHADGHGLGAVVDSSTGFRLPGGDVRSPDVAFVAAERLAGRRVTGFFPGAPDLAVEIISPSDLPSEMADKIHQYFAAGTQLVWVVDPLRQTVTVHGTSGAPHVLTSGDAIDGGDVLPGFRYPVSKLFATR